MQHTIYIERVKVVKEKKKSRPLNNYTIERFRFLRFGPPFIKEPAGKLRNYGYFEACGLLEV